MIGKRCSDEKGIGWSKMKSNKITSHLIGLACLLSFVWLYFATKNKYDNLYLFEWTADHSYLYIWAWVFYLTAVRKEIIAIALSAGNLFGVIVGQVYGSYLFDIDMAKLEAGVDIGRGYPENYSFAIYIYSLLAAFILGVLIQFNFFKNWKWQKQMDEDEWKRAVWAHIAGIICLVAFQVLWADSYSPDMEHFVSGWTAEYHYLYCWALIYYFTGIGKPVLSVSLTLGNFAGVYLGDRVGGFFRELAMRKIPWDIPNEEMRLAYQMYYQNHNGLAIWAVCVILFMLLGVYIQKKGLRPKCPGWLKRGLIRLKDWWLRIYNA